MKKFRLIQLLTGFHYIHHIQYSFGFKIPFIEFAYFKNFGFKRTNTLKLRGKNGKDIKKPYHNCTLSGVY
jgi:hypothetical protein